VRPASFHGTVRVTATGARKLGARASGGRGSYRVQFVFPSSGGWKLTARAGSTTSRLGTVQVRPVPPQPVTFVEPTAIDAQPDGTLLLVENNPGSLLRVDPRTGSVTPVAVMKLIAIRIVPHAARSPRAGGPAGGGPVGASPRFRAAIVSTHSGDVGRSAGPRRPSFLAMISE